LSCASGPLGAGLDLGADAGDGRAGERVAAHLVDQRAVQSEQGPGDGLGHDVIGLGAGLLGEQRGERLRVAVEHLALARAAPGSL
jgi:hypothetical protein